RPRRPRREDVGVLRPRPVEPHHVSAGADSARPGAGLRTARGPRAPRRARAGPVLRVAAAARVRPVPDAPCRTVSVRVWGASRRRDHRCAWGERRSRDRGRPEARPPLTRGVRTALESMLEARSVAVVGASARPGSFGEQMMIQLMRGGFDGAVYPVNPRYQDVLGQRCLSSLADLPEPADLVLLGVSNIHLEDQLQAAANAGIRSAVIFATCYDRSEKGKPRLTERLASIARASGMALCGGNGMGFLNLERRLRACGFSEPEGLEPGPITFVSHSGSAFSAMLHNERGLRFNLAVSSGLELVTTTADYLEYALDQPSTKLIALFIETARNPRGFRAALARAADQDVPVIALKVGRTAPAKDLVTAHSGALAGEDGAYEALFEMHGVIRVQTLDEMADTLELFTAGRRAGPGGLAA